jgi:hypothetical protein
VEVYAYMMHLPVEHWGRAFLERGTAQCRFTNPVYDGATAEVIGREYGDAMQIEVTSGGRSCATGSARLPADAPLPPALDGFPPASPPAMESRPAASPETLQVGAILGSIPMEANREHSAGYLRDVRETDGLYAREGLVHPGAVLRMGNLGLLQNVLLGPWIHVGSEVRNFSAARVGETLVARPRIAANYERKGHLFVEIDVLVLGDGRRPLAQLRHTAIYRPRLAAEAKA